jgi:PAS domain S-box-containing protein
LSTNTRSFIGTPIKLRMLGDGALYGTLCAVDPGPQTLTCQQADLLVIPARLLATQIERQQAEQELRLRDRAIAASDTGIIITDPRLPDNPIVYASEGFLRMTGYDEEEVVGRNCRFLQEQDRDQPELDEVRKAIREDRISAALRRCCIGGRVRPWMRSACATSRRSSLRSSTPEPS